MADTFTISLPSGDAFSADANENLLASAQRAHWLVRHGCRNGNCQACAATLLRGSVLQEGRRIDAADSQQNEILLCLSQARTDLQIDLPGDPQHGSPRQAQRRYVRVIDREPIAEGWWRLRFALPAGRQSRCFAGQYVSMASATDPQAPTLRADIDVLASSGRELCVICAQPPALAIGDYLHLRYPLGYCYATRPLPSVVILFEPDHRAQALQLRDYFEAQRHPETQRDHKRTNPAPRHDFEARRDGPEPQSDASTRQNTAPTLIEIADDDIPALALQHNTTVFACAGGQNARLWFETLLSRGDAFLEFRSDDAIWRRWRVRRQDDNGNRFIVADALSEADARALAAELESRGHKQLYWAEPIM